MQWNNANANVSGTAVKIEQRPYPDVITTASHDGLRRDNIWFRFYRKLGAWHGNLYILDEPAAIYQNITEF